VEGKHAVNPIGVRTGDNPEQDNVCVEFSLLSAHRLQSTLPFAELNRSFTGDQKTCDLHIRFQPSVNTGPHGENPVFASHRIPMLLADNHPVQRR
jgi:hypothetical protein